MLMDPMVINNRKGGPTRLRGTTKKSQKGSLTRPDTMIIKERKNRANSPLVQKPNEPRGTNGTINT